MGEEEIDEILTRYLDGTASVDEAVLVENWYADYARKQELPDTDPDFVLVKQATWDNLKNFQRGRSIRLFSYAAAAVALISLSVIFYVVFKPVERLQKSDLSAAVKDIAPGKNTAVLTLSNGKTIQLSERKTGVVIGAALSYSDGSTISGTTLSAEERGPVQLLTASTPRGGTYRVELPDGTRVWLNAATTLRFPSAFAKTGNRTVELTGEAYFEVAKDKAHPFIVSTASQTVRVLGTHFNINAYQEELNVKTTLLEGAVSVTTNDKSQSVKISPGKQAVLDPSGALTVGDVDVESAVSWKNSQFMFDGETIQPIMRSIARWYNVDIRYVGEITNEKFIGGVSRFDNVSKVLKSLESTGKVHFRLEGRTIIVSK